MRYKNRRLLYFTHQALKQAIDVKSWRPVVETGDLLNDHATPGYSRLETDHRWTSDSNIGPEAAQDRGHRYDRPLPSIYALRR